MSRPIKGLPDDPTFSLTTKLTLKPLVHLIEEIGRDLVGKAVAPTDLMAQMDAKFRLLSWQGLVGMAVSGLDMAFHDALGQAAGQPLAQLLGGSPRPMRAYDSYGVVDPVSDEKDLKRSLDQGFRGIKIKGGDGDAANDERMVKGVRKLIGPDIALMIDFNQSLGPAEAISRIARLAPYDLHWVEEPVAQENLQGLAAVRRESSISIQAGENWWFPRGFAEAIAAGGLRFHHARFDEGRRRHRLDAGRGPSRSRFNSDVEPFVRRSQRPHAGGDADRALAGSSRSRPRYSGRTDADRGRRDYRAWTWTWAGLGRGRGGEIFGVICLRRTGDRFAAAQ